HVRATFDSDLIGQGVGIGPGERDERSSLRTGACEVEARRRRGGMIAERPIDREVIDAADQDFAVGYRRGDKLDRAAGLIAETDRIAVVQLGRWSRCREIVGT